MEASPYRPAAHGVHDAAPGRLYVPAGHDTWVGDVDPGGHMYPAVQLPEHAGVRRAAASPNVPPGQGGHTAAPPVLYWPGAQGAAVVLGEPAVHTYPAAQ